MSTTSGRRLYRSRDDRMIAGVCGGLGEYLGVDPTVIRLLAVASIFLPGPQVIAYLLAWLIIPEAPPAATAAPPVPPAPARPTATDAREPHDASTAPSATER